MAPRKRPPASKRKASSRTPRRSPKPKPASPGRKAPGEAPSTLPIEVQPGAIDEALRKVTDTLRQWANAGRYTKVRFKFRGKPLLPDLPLAAGPGIGEDTGTVHRLRGARDRARPVAAAPAAGDPDGVDPEAMARRRSAPPNRPDRERPEVGETLPERRGP